MTRLRMYLQVTSPGPEIRHCTAPAERTCAEIRHSTAPTENTCAEIRHSIARAEKTAGPTFSRAWARGHQ